MPNGITNPSQPGTTSTGADDVIGFGDYIDRQLHKVRTFVRLSDLAVAIATCAAVVCTLLFVVILVDHWLFDLGPIGRVAALATLLGIVGYFGFAWILPLVVKRMNPAYVAHVIEQGEPSLKNGLLNFVLFRAQPQSVRKVILEAVERRAAVDLSRINVDTTIDRTPLIRIGAALGALLVGLALYAFLSPKDPLQTIARVLIPWSDRARPSRVQILDVEPGNTTAYAGQQLPVNATIENLAASERATIVYSTPDGQVVDARLDMRPDGDARWSAKIPETGDGLQQDVTYQITAGDAVAGPFRVDVLPSPSIVVDRLEYDYPDYTGRAAMVVEQAGDINAIEGTRVTVKATANQDIDYAYVEFDAIDAVSKTTDNNAANPRQTLTMKHDGRQASTSFTLHLQPDHRTPWHLNYQVRFRNLDGATNDRPIRYDIQVTPDIPPVVEILTPSQRKLNVAVDATQSIEIRAVDPDYGLTGIALRAVTGNTPLLDESLLEPDSQDSQTAFTGQQMVKYAFTPAKLGLQPGDEVVYWARASDNRTKPGTSTAAPNVAKTPEYRFQITDAQSSRDKSSEKGDTAPAENGEQGATKNGAGDPNQADPDQDGPGAGDPDNGANSDQTDQTDRQQDDSPDGSDDGQGSSEGEKNEGEPGQEGNAQENNDGAQGQNAQQQQDNGNPGGAANERQDSDDTSDQTDNSQPNGTAAKTGEENDGQPARDAGAASDESQSPNSNDNAGEKTDQSAQADGQRSNATDEEDSQTERQNGNSKSSPSDAGDEKSNADSASSDDDSQPLPNDGTRDGEAMERILEEIRKRTGEKPEDATNRPCDKCADGSCQDCQDAAQGDSSGEKSDGSPGGKKNGSSANDQNDSQRPSGTDGQREGTDDTQQNDASQNGDSEQNDAQDAGSQDAGEAGQTGDSGVNDSPSQDAREPGQDTSAQPKPDDADNAATTDDAASETDRQPAPSNENNTGPAGDSDQQSTEQPGESNQASPTGDPNDSADPNGTSSSTGEGATAPDGGSSSPAGDGAAAGDVEELGADEANLDYARKATDLVLDYLKDQENRRDRDLLDELGWSPEDLEEFRKRWNQMKRDAEQNNPVGVSARRELDEVLRSLGLTPTRDRLRAAGSRDDSVQVRNTGRRSKPPVSYRERYERFLKSISNQDSSP